MEAKDLLNIDVIKVIEKQALREARKFKKFSQKPVQATRVYHARLGRIYWKNQARWKYKNGLRQKKSKADRLLQREEINRVYANRCPKRYETYIKSKWWTERKNKYYQAHGRKCAICDSVTHVDLHHIWYGNYGSEPNEQLIPFCRKHHLAFHKKYGFGMNDFSRQTAQFLKDNEIPL